jgi:2',3'-cyclic-nucleotide 2'-phosphodiesterase (5'-nucleotidase family)
MMRKRAWQGLLATAMIAVAVPVGAQTTDVALDTTAALTAECSFADLTADAIRAAANADIALVNGSVFRPKTVPAGKIEAAAVEEFLVDPAEPVAVLTLTGASIRAALERGLTLLPLPNKGFLHVSGIQVVFDSTKPRGQRVQRIEINRVALQPERTYTVALPGALAKGGLGYFLVFNGAAYREVTPTIFDAVTSYLKAHPQIGADLSGRLRDAGRMRTD